MNKIFAITLLGLLVLSGCGNPKSISFSELELYTLQGDQVNLTQYAGKRILLNFWATWCGPCRKELPSMQEALNQLDREGYVFLLVSNETPETLQAFREKHDFDFEYLYMPQSMKLLGIFSIPQTYLIDGSGAVVHAVSGPLDWSAPSAVDVLQQLE